MKECDLYCSKCKNTKYLDKDCTSTRYLHNAIAKDHPIDQVVGDINKCVQT
jgi:hypothetical protein